MERVAPVGRRLLTAVVLVHLVGSLLHGAAHAAANVRLSPAATLFVAVVILAGPLIGLALCRINRRAGDATIALALAGACLFGFVNHFALAGTDHVSHVAAAWRPLFAWTAAMLAVLEAGGAAIAVRLLKGAVYS